MPDVHPRHSGRPSLYLAEVTGFRGRWTMSVIDPDRVIAGPNIDLGPADILTVAHTDDPWRYLIAIDGEVPVRPREEAMRVLENTASSLRPPPATTPGSITAGPKSLPHSAPLRVGPPA